MNKLPQGERDLGTLVLLQDWLTLTKLCSSPLEHWLVGVVAILRLPGT